MPLSDDEIRILQEIEKNFYDSDPAFARETTPVSARQAARNIRLAAVGCVVGLIILVAFFTTSVVIGFLGFCVMVGSGFVLYMNLAKLGRDGVSSVAARTGNLGDALGKRRERLRERFRRNED